MKKLTCSIVLFFGLVFSFAANCTPFSSIYPYSTSGSKIVNARGKEVILHGVNISGLEWGAGSPLEKKCNDPQWADKFGCFEVPPATMYDRIAALGFNVVRIPVSWANIEPEMGKPYNEKYLAALDLIVAEFAKRRIGVIFCMHQWAWSPVIMVNKDNKFVHGNGWPVWLYDAQWFTHNPLTGRQRDKPLTNLMDGQDAASREFFANQRLIDHKKIQTKFIEVWSMLAARYRQQTLVIGADIINEPYGNHDNQLEDLYLHAAQAIHKANPNLLLLFQASVSKPKLHANYFLRNSAFPRHKAIYSIHLYSTNWDKLQKNKPGYNKNLGIRKIDRAMNQAELWQVPLWIGEFHLIVTKTDRIKPIQSKKMLNYFYKDRPAGKGNGKINIAWTYWAYQKDKFALAGESGHELINHQIVDLLIL